MTCYIDIKLNTAQSERLEKGVTPGETEIAVALVRRVARIHPEREPMNALAPRKDGESHLIGGFLYYKETFIPFENTLINVSRLTHAVKISGSIFLYFGEDSASLSFQGESASQLWGLLMAHEKNAPSLSLKF